MPPIPWIPSIITEEYSPVLSSLRTVSMSLSSTNVTSRPALTGATYLGISVTLTAAEVLPWNDFLKLNILYLSYHGEVLKLVTRRPC